MKLLPLLLFFFFSLVVVALAAVEDGEEEEAEDSLLRYDGEVNIGEAKDKNTRFRKKKGGKNLRLFCYHDDLNRRFRSLIDGFCY